MAAPRCPYCGRFFSAHPRVCRGPTRQKTCGRTPCRRANDRRRQRTWLARNPGYGASRHAKVRAWAKEFPVYWRRYRAGAARYRERERQRMRRKRRDDLRVAKQTAIHEILVGKLLAVKRAGPKPVAKQTAIARRVNALVDVLVWRERVAKQSPMAMPAGPAG